MKPQKKQAGTTTPAARQPKAPESNIEQMIAAGQQRISEIQSATRNNEDLIREAQRINKNLEQEALQIVGRINTLQEVQQMGTSVFDKLQEGPQTPTPATTPVTAVQNAPAN